MAVSVGSNQGTYLDQLERSQALALPADQIAGVRKAIQSAESTGLKAKEIAKLKSFAPSLKASAAKTKSPVDAKRLQALAEILQRPSK